MFESRLYLTNGTISYELDALNGEPLAFTREDRADNARKNHFLEITGVLDGEIYIDETICHLNIPRYAQIRENPEIKPEISVRQGDGEAEAEIFYPKLVAAEKPVDVSARVTLRLPKNSCESIWKLTLENRTENEITKLSFPELSGLWLGDTWEDNTLMLPRVSGSKVENPTKVLADKPTVITWKWQEYLHKYRLNRNGTKDDRGLHIFRCPYTGGGSMLWMDLYSRNENSGIYITARDEKMHMADVHAYSMGEYCPGVGMGVCHYPVFKDGTWESPEGILAFHEGDWHWAADTYHAMRDSYKKPLLDAPAMPDWFTKSPGLAAHYDFKYQGGGIVHTFADIPELYKKAQTWGLDHLLIAGWHEDGFDYGFPHYKPDPELGGEEALKKAVAEVHAMGGYVSFYLNSRLCNVDFPDQQKRIEKSAVMRRNGQLFVENYGAGDVRFATLCMNERSWREAFAADIHNVLSTINADGVYLDQLAMALSSTCYHPGHTEHKGDPAVWNQGYEKLFDILRRENPGKALFYEGCSDIYGRGVAGQLVSTLRQVRDGVTPEMYRYTFPDEVLLDMENPRRHSGMRAEHIARRSTFYLYRGFVCGLYFWVYDLEMDNTFSRDPEQEARLQKITALRSAWLKKFGFGTFRDQEFLVDVGENELKKRYVLSDGSTLLALADEKGLTGTVKVRWNKEAPQVTIYTCDAPDTPITPETCLFDGVLSVKLPATEACIIHIA